MRVPEEPICNHFFRQNPVFTSLHLKSRRRYDMNGRFQMQGGKNLILPKDIHTNRFFRDSHWQEIWTTHFFPSMGPNGLRSCRTASGNPESVTMINFTCLFYFLHLSAGATSARWPICRSDNNSKIALYENTCGLESDQIWK